MTNEQRSEYMQQLQTVDDELYTITLIVDLHQKVIQEKMTTAEALETLARRLGHLT